MGLDSARTYDNVNGNKLCRRRNVPNANSVSINGQCSANETYNHLRGLCRERNVLFEDPQFVPSNKILFGKRENGQKINFSWMRPYQLVSRPRFINEGNGTFDIEMGVNGGQKSPLVSALSCLTQTPKLLDRVVPSEQSFITSNYTGIFRFRFWKFGEWCEIVIDDQLPCYKGRLMYLHSSDPTEFWPALLEKAYAKLYGSYENYLRNCFTAQTLQDLTGGIAQSFIIPQHDGHIIYQLIASAVPRSTLLSVCINDESNNISLRNGLIVRQSYSITGLTRVRTSRAAIEGQSYYNKHNYHQNCDVSLIRLRNAYGKGEWNGEWSQRSFEWDLLNDRDKNELSRCDDGEFWMSFDDFLHHFTHLDIIHIGPDDWIQEVTLHNKRPWRAVLARRRWRKGFNAGGGPNNKETFATNPQFHIQIPKFGGNKLHVVVSVTQLYEINNELPIQNIGFCVFEVPPSLLRLTHTYVMNNRPLDVTAFTATRETVTFFTLPPGDFIIVPCTEKSHTETKFILRIFTDDASNIWEVNDDNHIFDFYVPKVVETIGGQNGHNVLSRLYAKLPPEIDAFTLLKVLKAYWKPILFDKPTIELCRCLIMLKDPTITGKISVKDSIAHVLNTLHFWRSIFTKHQNRDKVCSYKLRTLIWESGISVSNKVLECLVIRYANDTFITLDAFLLSLVKLNIAHYRNRTLQRKGKNHNLTLEEMILLTVYS